MVPTKETPWQVSGEPRTQVVKGITVEVPTVSGPSSAMRKSPGLLRGSLRSLWRTFVEVALGVAIAEEARLGDAIEFGFADPAEVQGHGIER